MRPETSTERFQHPDTPNDPRFPGIGDPGTRDIKVLEESLREQSVTDFCDIHRPEISKSQRCSRTSNIQRTKTL